MIGNGRFAALAAMAMMGGALVGAGSTVQPIKMERGVYQGMRVIESPAKPQRSVPSMATLAASLWGRGTGGTRGWQRARGPGWTNAHAKRVARKARNVRAHRARSRS